MNLVFKICCPRCRRFVFEISEGKSGTRCCQIELSACVEGDRLTLVCEPVKESNVARTNRDRVHSG